MMGLKDGEDDEFDGPFKRLDKKLNSRNHVHGDMLDRDNPTEATPSRNTVHHVALLSHNRSSPQ